jgi:hypothetical protein
MDIVTLKRLHDKAYTHNQVTRERAANDLVFYWVTQWDDNLLDQSQLQYRGEFNVLRKAGRQIIQDLRANPVQVDFEPLDDDRDDGADILDGLYRTDDRKNISMEAYDTASAEAVVCGAGAWELYTEYQTNRIGDENQIICRCPLYEANNTVFWDPNAKRLDKADADYVSILQSYSEDGYKKLVKELTGDELDSVNASNFAQPETSFVFPWIGGQNTYIYVVNFYTREKVKDTVIQLTDPLGQMMWLMASTVDDIMDDLIDAGYEIIGQRDIMRWQIKKYIASGERIIKAYDVPGENIPVVPMYGERQFVEGEEHYEGVTRLAKDPQRLRNFQLSYLADIVSRSPRQKPIFWPEQIQGYEFMYDEGGSDNNYPYLYQNRYDAQGRELPVGVVAQMPEQPMPTALAASIDLSRQAVEDVANPGVPQDIADPDLSGKAVLALQRRLDQQSMVYQQNLKHAKRRDGEIYASMAAQVYDTPRMVTLTLPDGSRKKAMTMQAVIDGATGEMRVLNDLSNMAFDVYADIGPNYATKKEETREELGAIAAEVGKTDPLMQKALILKRITLMDGVDMNDIRDYANKQLVLGGFRPPETDEEKALAARAAQQSQRPDAAMMLAQAEMLKGQADILKERRETAKDAATAANAQAKTQIDAFKAQTDRAAVEVDAAKAGAEINYKQIQSYGARIDNAAKAAGFRARVRRNGNQLADPAAI